MTDPTIEDLQRQIAELTAKVAQHEADKGALLSGEAPRYRLLQPFYAPDDVLYGEGTEIVLAPNVPPNEHMEPLNDAARRALIPVLQAITKKPLDQQIYDAKVLLHERDRLAAQPVQAQVDPASIVFPKKDDGVPIMPNHTLPGQRPRGRPKKVLDAVLPDVSNRPKAPVMGTVVLQGRDGALNTGGGLST